MSLHDSVSERIVADVEADLGRAYPLLPERLVDFYRATNWSSTLEEDGESFTIPLPPQQVHGQLLDAKLHVGDDYITGETSLQYCLDGSRVGTATYLASLLRGERDGPRPLMQHEDRTKESEPLNERTRNFVIATCVEAVAHNGDTFGRYGIASVDELIDADFAAISEQTRAARFASFEAIRVKTPQSFSERPGWK